MHDMQFTPALERKRLIGENQHVEFGSAQLDRLRRSRFGSGNAESGTSVHEGTGPVLVVSSCADWGPAKSQAREPTSDSMVTQSKDHNGSDEQVCPVFLCYRRTDGTITAEWLYRHLDYAQRGTINLTALAHEGMKLAIYYDQTAPVVSDWQAVHGSALRQSRAMILVSTPGSAVRLNSDDWVHNEIDWWLKNRKVAPIVIDATGEGERWVPQSVTRRWPDAQRLVLITDEWDRLSQEERRIYEERMLSRILRGISLSERHVINEDLAREQRISRRLRFAITCVIALLVIAVGTAGVALWQYRETDKAKATVQLQADELLKTQAKLVGALNSANENADAAKTQQGIAEKQKNRAIIGEAAAKEQKKIADAQRKLAFDEAKRADSRSRIAEARRLAAEAVNASPLSPQLANLLAVESIRTTQRMGEPAEPAAQTALRTVLSATEGSVLCRVGAPIGWFHISPDGDRAVVVAIDKSSLEVHRLDRADAPPTTLADGANARALTVDPAGRFLAALSGESLLVWDLEHPESRPLALSAEVRSLTYLVFLPGGRRLAALKSTTDPRNRQVRTALQVWDLDRPDNAATQYEGGAGFDLGLHVASGAPIVASVSSLTNASATPGTPVQSQSTIRVWDLTGTQSGARVLGQFDGFVSEIALHPLGKSLAALFSDGIRVFALGQPDLPPVVLPLAEKPFAGRLVYHPLKNRLIMTLSNGRTTLGDDMIGTVSIWDLDHPGESPLRLLDTVGQVRDLMVHSNGRELVVTAASSRGISDRCVSYPSLTLPSRRRPKQHFAVMRVISLELNFTQTGAGWSAPPPTVPCGSGISGSLIQSPAFLVGMPKVHSYLLPTRLDSSILFSRASTASHSTLRAGGLLLWM